MLVASALDLTFDTDGRVTTNFGPAVNYANAVAVQPDGKIIAGGGSGAGAATNFALARYNPDGSLDTTFDTDGRVTTDFAGAHDAVRALVVQPDGKIVAAGGTGEGMPENFGLVRYNANGSLDTTFGTGGRVTTDFGLAGAFDIAHAVALQPDGKIVAAGRADFLVGNETFALARYNADGSPDLTFDTDGRIFSNGSLDEAFAVLIQPDGKIVAVGVGQGVSAGTDNFALARYLPNGNLDTSFGVIGRVSAAFPEVPSRAEAAALLPDGRILAVGEAGPAATKNVALAVFNANGSLNNAFSLDGRQTYDFGGADGSDAVTVQPDGRIVFAGERNVAGNYDFAVARVEYDVLQFSAAAFNVAETAGNVTIRVTRTGGSQGTLTVNFATSNRTAAAGFDYTPRAVTLTFENGVTEQTVTIPILDDALVEGVETVNLTLTLEGPQQLVSLGLVTSAVLAIRDNESPAFLVALTAQNRLLRFDSAAPGTTLSTVTVTGLQAGESLLGIDYRPANGQLYGLGSTSRLYTINAGTGAATQVGTGTFAVPLSGQTFGFDFNPVADRIRVTSDNKQNLRLNPNTGEVVDSDPAAAGVQPDTELAYAAGDPNAGQFPHIAGAAYTNNFAGATSTSLLGIDFSTLVLALQGSAGGSPTSPNTGQLFTVGALGVEATELVGFDIAAAGTGFATLNSLDPVTGRTVSRFYTVNVTTGAVTLVGPMGGTELIRGLAVVPQIVQFSAAAFSVNEGDGTVTITVNRLGGSDDTVTVSFATSDGTARAGVDYVAAAGTLTFAAGQTSQTFTVAIPNNTLVRRDRTVTLTLSGPAGGASLGALATATLTILDNDLPVVPNSPRPANLGVVASAFAKSREQFTNLVTAAYERFLRRAPDALGLEGWVSLMLAGTVTEERLEAGFIGSPEYIRNNGGQGRGWIVGMYRDLLGRGPAESEIQAWLNALQAGVTEPQVAFGFAASPERQGQRVQRNYRTFLDRDASPQEVAAWVDLFVRGLATNQDIVAGFVGSPEYYDNPTKGRGNRAHWIVTAYEQVLFRSPERAEVDAWLAVLQ